MEVHHKSNIVDGKVWLNKDEEAKEYLVFNKGILKDEESFYTVNWMKKLNLES